jgi:hypothetical protein
MRVFKSPYPSFIKKVFLSTSPISNIGGDNPARPFDIL